MVKSKARVEAKMKERVRTAGSELKAGMLEGPDPIDIALKDPAAHAKKMQDGLNEAIRRGKVEGGLKKAKERNSWKNSIDRAASNYEGAADRMVAHAMEDYDARAAAIERAKAKVAGMPRTTRAQRIAYGAAYAQAVGEEMDRLYGRKS
jgi:hypothetical protein